MLNFLLDFFIQIISDLILECFSVDPGDVLRHLIDNLPVLHDCLFILDFHFNLSKEDVLVDVIRIHSQDT